MEIFINYHLFASKVGLLFGEPEIPLCGTHSIGGAIWISLSSFHFLIYCSRLCGTPLGGTTRVLSLFEKNIKRLDPPLRYANFFVCASVALPPRFFFSLLSFSDCPVRNYCECLFLSHPYKSRCVNHIQFCLAHGSSGGWVSFSSFIIAYVAGIPNFRLSI